MLARRSLVARLAGLSTLWALALLIAGGIGLTALYRDTVFRDVDDRLDGDLRALAASVEITPEGDAVVEAPPADPRYHLVFSGRYWLVARIVEGRVEALQRSRSMWDDTVAIDAPILRRAAANRGQHVLGGGVGPAKEPLRLRLQVVELPNLEAPVLMAAGVDRREADRAVAAFAMAASWTLALFGVVLVAGVAWTVRWGLEPVFRMRDEVAEVREGARERLGADAPSELAPLAGELNALLDQNRDVVERARAHVGNLAHALKTPLSVLRNEARGAEGPFAEVVRRQTEAMAGQVDHHLKRASAAARAQSVGARAPLAPSLEDLCRIMPKIHAARAIALETEIAPDLVFRGERQDLEELLGNLLDNAFKWAAGRVRVTGAAGPAPGRMRLVVEDDGPGLAPEQRALALKRGARLDEAAPGTGLGLAIVDDLARAYGGRLDLGESALGGLAAMLDLPAAPRSRSTAR